MVRTMLIRMRREARISKGCKFRIVMLNAFVFTSLCFYRSVGYLTTKTVNNQLVLNVTTRRQTDNTFQTDDTFQTDTDFQTPVWSKDGRAYIKTVEPIVCNGENDWVYTENGTFYILAEAARKHKGVKCSVAQIMNVDDNFVVRKPVHNTKNGTDLIADAFKVQCIGGDKAKYTNVHACVSRSQNVNIIHNMAGRFNVFIYGFDSLSRNMFKRLLPKTHTYFTETLGGMLLGGYNIVGDGTFQTLLPMFTGLSEKELPEIRRGKSGAKPIDELVTFVWKRYAKEGYVTQWGEDMAYVGTFQYRLLGFREQPVHHYMRAFQLFAPTLYNDNKDGCLGSRPRHVVFQDWFKEGLNTNRGKNFFTVSFFSEFLHEQNNPVHLTDSENVDFLKYLGDKRFLDNTILILMSDNGIRYGPIRETEQSKADDRMPYFGFRFPDKFKIKYPDKMKEFEANTKRLSTPFDVHETLVDIIREDDAQWRHHTGKFKGQSLFKEIPKSRSCRDVGIDPHWCTFMQ